MKNIIKTCAVLSLAGIFTTSCVQGNNDPVDLGIKVPDLSTKVMEDFEKNDTKLFTASTGYSNGSPFGCDWNDKNVSYADGKMNLEISRGETKVYGGELRSRDSFHYGDYSVKMKPMAVDGTASTFFTYTGPHEGNPWDEIDIEFLGKDTTKVQFNYFTNGVGNHEYMYDLGFDASKEWHEYGFRWEKDAITWFVDNKPVYQATKDIPSTPGKIFMNAWAGDENGKGWMGLLPADFTSDKAVYEEIGFADKDGNAYVPQFELPPEYNIQDAKWTDIETKIGSTDVYTVESTAGTHHVTYTAAKGNSYENILTKLPEEAKKANSVKFKIKNNGTTDAAIRADVNEDKTHGTHNIRCINKLARKDGAELQTDFEWGGSKFSLQPGEESLIDIIYEGAASELMFMIDSFSGQEETKGGDITISEIQLGTYGDGQTGETKPEEPKPEPQPEVDTDTYYNLPLTFNGGEHYTVTETNGSHKVTYTDVPGQCYKNIAAPLPTDAFTATKVKFDITNNGTATVQARADVNEAKTHGANNIRCVNTRALKNGFEIRTDKEWGGSFFELAAGETATITVEYAGEANEFMIFIDSSTNNNDLHSGDITVSNIKLNKEITNNPVEPKPEPQPEEPKPEVQGTAIDPEFTTWFQNYQISKANGVTTVAYEGVKFQTYGCLTGKIDFTGKTSITFKVKNNTANTAKLKFDVIKTIVENNESKDKSVNLSATYKGTEIFTDLTYGGSSLDLTANDEGYVTINFNDPEAFALNIFIDSVYDEDVKTLHSGNISFSEFSVN